jgi:hypothetical protein
MARKHAWGALAVCGLVAALSLAAAAQNPVDIAGRYSVVGVNPDGGMYQGRAEISKRGATYRIRWVIGVSETYEGVGILEGDVLAVSFSSGTSSGVVVYRVDKGKLLGRWALLGSDAVHSETLTREL